MSQRQILVTGATGATGSKLVTELLRRDHAVRALAHHDDERANRLRAAGAEVIVGDLLDFNAVRSAFEGQQAAYFVYPIHAGILEASVYFAQAAKEVGSDIVVNMSQISARRDSKSGAARNHWLSERVFDKFGLPVTHVRPTFFAEWLLYIAPLIRAGFFRVPFFPEGRHAPIAAEDQARVIAAILAEPTAHVGKTYPLFGTKELSHAEIAEAVGRVLGRPLRVEYVSMGEFARLLSPRASGESGSSERAANQVLFQHLSEVAIDHKNGLFAGTNDLVAQIGGRAPLTVEAFVEKHRAAFGA
jgi:uncharacterized protein YbjT (DUF2867 family)